MQTVHRITKRTLNPSVTFWTAGVLLFVVVISGAISTNAITQSSKERMEQVILDMRTLYLDTYPDLKRIRVLRQEDKTEKTEQLRQKLEQTFDSRLKRIRNNLQKAEPEKAHLRERWNSLKSMISYFEEYQRKILENWKPKNPTVFRAYNTRELIDRGLAKPEMLRTHFLRELSGMLYTSGYVESNPVKQKLDRYEEEVRTMYTNVLDKFLYLLKQIRVAEEEDEKNEGSTNNKEKSLKQAQSSWTQFWQQLESKQNRLKKGINRELLLFRNRKKKYMVSAQRQEYERGLQIKRQFLEIMEFKKKKEIFKNEKQVRNLLVLMARKNVLRHIEFIKTQGIAVFSFFNQFATTSDLASSVHDGESYRKRSEQISQTVNLLYARRFGYVQKALNTAKDIPLKNLKRLSEALTERHENKKEKKLGKLVKKVWRFLTDFKEFADDSKGFPRKFKEKFQDVEFESVEQFKKEFSDSMEKKLKKLNSRNQKLSKRFIKIKKSAKSILDSLDEKEQDE